MPGGADDGGDGRPGGTAVLKVDPEVERLPPCPIAAAVERLKERVRRAAQGAGRDPSEVRILAASKRRTLAEIDAAAGAGIAGFGENYVPELLDKAVARPDLEWHFIGHLQRNKARRARPHIAMLHTLDNARLADVLQQLQIERPHRPPLPVLVQVNIGDEGSKAGVAPNEAADLCRHVLADCPDLRLDGLMTIPPPQNPERWPAAMAALRQRLRDELGTPLPHLSMGMSHDLEAAIRHGATFVRIGTAIFGSR